MFVVKFHKMSEDSIAGAQMKVCSVLFAGTQKDVAEEVPSWVRSWRWAGVCKAKRRRKSISRKGNSMCKSQRWIKALRILATEKNPEWLEYGVHRKKWGDVSLEKQDEASLWRALSVLVSSEDVILKQRFSSHIEIHTHLCFRKVTHLQDSTFWILPPWS